MPKMLPKSRSATAGAIVNILGFLLLFFYIRNFNFDWMWETFFFALFVLLGEWFTLSLPQGGAISISSAIVLAAIFLLPLPNVLVAAFLGTLGATFVSRRSLTFKKALTPIASKAMVIFLSWGMFILLGGRIQQLDTTEAGLALGATLVVYFLAEVSITQFFYALEKGTSFPSALLGAVRLLVPIYVAFSTLGVLMALLYKDLNVWSIFLLFPFLLVVGQSFRLYLNIRNTYRSTISTLSAAMEAQDPAKKGHAERVANYSIDIAREMGVYGKSLEEVGYAATLHDIGKLGLDRNVSDSSKGKDKEEREKLDSHAQLGADILENVAYLKDASDLVRYHHTSYEIGKRRTLEEDHPLGARIIQVANSYDELTITESRKDNHRPKEALDRIKKEQGINFDPKVVRAFARVLRRQGQLR